jgi:hypothetical protein
VENRHYLKQPMITVEELQALYKTFNTQYFDDALPPCRIQWSRQLTRAAGNINVRARLIKLSVPIFEEAFEKDTLFAPEYLVCGVSCNNSCSAVREILKHEMIHLWLFEQKLPSGHTALFRAKAKSMGQSGIRHNIALPPRKSGWEYSCSHCQITFVRRRRYGRAVACGKCCDKWGNGRFDARFKLKGRRLS